MATTKSQAITNLDTIPVVPLTTGEGGPGMTRAISNSVAVGAGDAAGTIYIFSRIPTNAKIKRIYMFNTAMTAGALDIDVSYSDSTIDGTPTSLRGTVVQVAAADNKMFGAAVSVAAANVTGQALDYANLTGFPLATGNSSATNYPLGSKNTPLWVLLGLAQDPGGMFDITGKVTTAMTAAGTIEIDLFYVD